MTSNSSIQRRPDPDSRNERLVDARSAERVLAFFKAEMKSRLTVSPWHQGRIRLDNGLSNVPLLTEVREPKPVPFNSRPAA